MATMQLGRFLAAALALLAAGSTLADDVEQCTKDTWGMAGEKYAKPFVRVNREQLVCNLQEADISKIPLFAVNWYNTSEDFDQGWLGVDMNPKRHWEYRNSPWEAFRLGHLRPWNKTNGPPFQKSDISLSSCEIPQEDGSFYRVQRVGPLVSTGGYDYWQFGWRDVWGLREVLKRHPEGLMMTTSFSAGVLADGTALSFPPIHIHHIHIGPYTISADGTKLGVGVKVKEPSDAVLGLEQHGDYECKEVDGGTDCLFERVAEGFAKVLTMPLSLEGELNDVRAFFSEPITWWYQIVLHYRPYTQTLRPLSQSFVIGPGPEGLNQLSTLLVFPTPTAEDSFYWYISSMPHSGMLVRNKIHSHNSQFHKAFFFHASPEQLGLDEPRFDMGESPPLGCGGGGAPCIPQPLRKTGFASFEDFRIHLIGKLAKAAAAHDRSCSSFLGTSRCQTQRPALICQANSSHQNVRDPRSGKMFSYDRRGPSCCRPWTFAEGDLFTVVGFMRKAEHAPGPWSPDIVPETLPMHLHWVMTFDTMDNSSYYVNQGTNWFTALQGSKAKIPTWTAVEAPLPQSAEPPVRFFDAGGWSSKTIYLPKDRREFVPRLEESEGEGDLAGFMTVSQSVQRRGSRRLESLARFAGAAMSMATLWFAGRRWRRDCSAAVHCVRLWVPRFPSLRVKYVQHAV